MIPRRSLALAAPVVGLLCASAMTGSASADVTQTLGCRASVARVDALPGGLAVEPFVANATGGPCATASAGLSSSQPLNIGGLSAALGGALQVGPATATTTSTDNGTQLGAGSLVSVTAASIPTPAGAISIVGPVQTSASYQCVNGTVMPNASSTLSALQIGSNRIALSSPGQSDTIPLYGQVNLLGQTPVIGSVSVNQNVSTATSNTETLLDVQINGLADVVVGEAAVTQPAAGACAGVPNGGDPIPDPTNPGSPGAGSPGGPGGPGSPGGSGAASSTGGCPLGTIAAGSACTLGSGSNATFVMNAYSGDISGAAVVSLAYARRHYRSACLRGSGPKFVVVGTNKANRITVKKRRFRVLGLGGNDRITVVGGNRTCVDGGAGRDRIVNLKSNRVSIYAGGGADLIRVGNGPAYISAGSGNDRIIAGRGRDVIKAGSGRNVVIARGPHALVSASGRRTVAHLLRPAMRYARRHGVRRVFVLR